MPTPLDYLNLITSFHSNRPKFRSMVQTLVTYFTDLQGVINNLPNDFCIDFAIGVQLDAVGKWIGRSRVISIPLPDPWFRFDDFTRGFDAGLWFGPFTVIPGQVVLDDDTYRTLLRAKILANEWDGSTEGAIAAFEKMFSILPSSLVIVDDKGDNSMVVGAAGVVPSILLLALLEDDFLPVKPEAVRRYFRVISNATTGEVIGLQDGQDLELQDGQILATQNAKWPLFGFDVSNDYIGGFDQSSIGVPPEFYTNGGKPIPVLPRSGPSLDFSDEFNSQYQPLI